MLSARPLGAAAGRGQQMAAADGGLPRPAVRGEVDRDLAEPSHSTPSAKAPATNTTGRTTSGRASLARAGAAGAAPSVGTDREAVARPLWGRRPSRPEFTSTRTSGATRGDEPSLARGLLSPSGVTPYRGQQSSRPLS